MDSFPCESSLTILLVDSTPGVCFLSVYLNTYEHLESNGIIAEVQVKLRHRLFHLPYCSVELPEDVRRMVFDGYKNGNTPHQVRSM